MERTPSLEVDLAPRNPRELRLRNPIIAASGCFGFGVEYRGQIDADRMGAFVCTSVTRKPGAGLPLPRIVETPAGLLHAVGFDNPGFRAFARTYPPKWAAWDVPGIVSLAGETIDEFVEMARALDEVNGVAGIEVNLSSPVRDDNRRFGDDPDLTYGLVEAMRAATTLPLIAKLGPSAPDIVETARAAEEAGADALSLINAVDALAVDVRRRGPALGGGRGGMSGPAIRPIAIRMVHDVAGAVSVPIIGGGGIVGLNDVLEFLMVGATAVQVGSAIYSRPRVVVDLVDELARWMERNGVEHVGEIVGVGRANGVL